MRGPRSTLALLGAAAAAAVAIPLGAVAGPGSPLPDLVSEAPDRPITSIHSDGRLLLRFDGHVTNRAGAGPLEIRAQDPDAQGRMRDVAQYRGDGARLPTPPGLTVVFERADSHNHYHLKNAAEYTLWTADRAAQVALAQKTEAGFCLEDSRPRGGGPARYDSDRSDFCRTVPLVMGISAGWADLYHRDLAFQWIDISSTAPGDYALANRVDPAGVVAEQDEANPHAFRPVVVPGYRAEPLTSPHLEAGQETTLTLGARRFAGGGDPYSPGPARFRIESLPSRGTISQGGRTLAAGDVLSDPRVTYRASAAGPDGFSYSAFDPGRAEFPRDPATGAPAYPAASVLIGASAVAISGAPASLLAGLGVRLTATVAGGPPQVTWSASAGRIDAGGLFVAPDRPPPGELVTVRAQSVANPSVAAEVRIRIVQAGVQRAAYGAACAPVPPAARAARDRGSRVRLSARQLLVNQRISQAAVLRAAAIERWLDAGLRARDLCGGSIGPDKLAPGIVAGPSASAAAATPARPRPLRMARPRRDGGAVTLSRRQLLINQRVSQAAIRRLNGLRARLAGRLTGGDLRPGAVTAGKLRGGIAILAAGAAPRPRPSATPLARRTRDGAAGLELSAAQLLVNQRIAQAAVRRANALARAARRGLTGENFRDGSIVAANLARELRP